MLRNIKGGSPQQDKGESRWSAAVLLCGSRVLAVQLTVVEADLKAMRIPEALAKDFAKALRARYSYRQCCPVMTD